MFHGILDQKLCTKLGEQTHWFTSPCSDPQNVHIVKGFFKLLNFQLWWRAIFFLHFDEAILCALGVYIPQNTYSPEFKNCVGVKLFDSPSWNRCMPFPVAIWLLLITKSFFCDRVGRFMLRKKVWVGWGTGCDHRNFTMFFFLKSLHFQLS